MKYIVNLKRFTPGDCYTCHELDVCVREEWSCPIFNAVPVKEIKSKEWHSGNKKVKLFVTEAKK